MEDDPQIYVMGGVLILGLLLLAGAMLAGARGRTETHVSLLAQSIERLAASQSEQAGRIAQLAEDQAASQGQLAKRLEERLENLSGRLGEGLTEHSRQTGETMNRLHERLATIDAAQRNIAQLSQQVVGLQDILANKQARGAFGEIQLNDLVSAALPPSAYEMQARLSNGRIADCLLKLPNPPGSIAIDAKFPLESYRALVDAGSSDETARVKAGRSFAADVRQHVVDIADRYILVGETAESALMFLPSEAIYAELHANFRPVIEESFRRRVWIVSPTTMMATLNTVRAVLRDTHMREQAGVIQREVLALLDDVGRLDERVEKLQRDFERAAEDIRLIRISTEKVVRRAARIDELQLGEEGPAADLPPPGG